MPIAAINVYIDRLPDRILQLRGLMVEAASWPHMSESERRKADRTWGRQISSAPEEPRRRLPPAMLPFIGIGVRYADKEG